MKDTDYVVVLDPPESPLYPSGPRKKRMVIFAGLIGISLGIVLAFAIEYFSKNTADQDEMRNIKTLIWKNLTDFKIFRWFWMWKI